MKDANELLVLEGPERFAKAWVQRRSEASAAAAVTTAPEPAPVMPMLSSPAAQPRAAKEENLPHLALDETGAYVLTLGERTYRIRGLTAFGVDRLRVNLRIDQAARFHVDTFDLYSSRSRGAFVEAAIKALHLQESEAAALTEELAALIEALEKERLSLRGKGEAKTEPAAMTSAEKAEAMGMLKGDVVSCLKRDFVSVGCIGEETALLIGYFALVSRKLDEPLSVLFCARSGAGKSILQDRLCDFCPPEDLVKYTRISGQVLFYKDEDALKHKLLAVDEEDGASSAAYALRSLLSSGYLSCSVTRTDPHTGRQVDDDRRVNGPTSVFMTTAHPEAFDYETRNRYVLVTVDESKEQTKRILELQRWNETVDGLLAREKRKAIFRRHHNAQRLLEPLEVVIPVALAYPSGQLILRREQKKYLSLIKSIALLHQHQRARRTLRVDGHAVEYVEATTGDVEIARNLARAILTRNLDELSPPSRSLLVAMRQIVDEKTKARPAAKEKKQKTPRGPERVRRYVLHGEDDADGDERRFLDRREIQRATGLTLWHIKAYMPQLIEYEYVAQVSGRRGARCRYELIDDENEVAPVAKAPHMADLAEPGAPGLSERTEAEPAS